MNDHFLIKMANVLHQICPTIIKGEGWLVEPPRKACTLDPLCERRFSDLAQCFIHGLVSKALIRCTFSLMPIVTVFLVAGESFTGWSSGSLPVRVISVSSEEDSDLNDDRLHRARRNFFFNSSISRCMSFSFSAWDT